MMQAQRRVRSWAAAARLRVLRDAEGWPVIPGRLGRIEWQSPTELAVFTDRPSMHRRLWAIPGVRRWQVGDKEVRGLFPPEVLPAVAALIRARRRRVRPPLTPEGRATLLARLHHTGGYTGPESRPTSPPLSP